MKFNELRSIGNNIADSLASGVGLLIGSYELDVFDEARQSPQSSITVDFLAGRCVEGSASLSLATAIAQYGLALKDLCKRHGTSSAAFRVLQARYVAGDLSPRFFVTVEDQRGRSSMDEYEGIPGSRAKIIDPLGRIRPKPAGRP
jgi:hypothetical protein